MVQHCPHRYVVPQGRVGRRFISMVAHEFEMVRERHSNSERPMVFIATILEKAPGVVKASDIRRRLEQRMDYWEQGHHVALTDDTETLMEARSHPGRRPSDPEAQARAFHGKVLSGRLRSAVRGLTSREGGGVFHPDDPCSKTGRPVLDVLKEKHPDLREPPLIGHPHGAFEPVEADEWKKPIQLDFTAELVEQVGRHLSGSAGPDGVDSTDLRHWLLQFGKESERLRQEMAAWCSWLANECPPWAAY